MDQPEAWQDKKVDLAARKMPFLHNTTSFQKGEEEYLGVKYLGCNINPLVPRVEKIKIYKLTLNDL